MTRKFKVAVAGLGFGASVHIPAYKSIKNIEIIAVSGQDVAKTRTIAKTLEISHAVSNYENLLDFNPDAVSIALPPDKNALASKFFLLNRIPIICEKPISGNLKEAEEIIKIDSKVPASVNFQFAELMAFKSAKELLIKGLLGPIESVEITWFAQSSNYKSSNSSWKNQTKKFGGVLYTLSPHVFYLLNWMISPIASIEANLFLDELKWNLNLPEAANQVAVKMLLQNEIPVNAIISRKDTNNSVHRWKIKCEKGTLIIENTGSDYMSQFSSKVLIGNSASLLHTQVPYFSGDSRIPPFISLAKRFIYAVKKNTPTFPNLMDGFRVQQVIEAVLISNSSAKSIKINKEN